MGAPTVRPPAGVVESVARGAVTPPPVVADLAGSAEADFVALWVGDEVVRVGLGAGVGVGVGVGVKLGVGVMDGDVVWASAATACELIATTRVTNATKRQAISLTSSQGRRAYASYARSPSMGKRTRGRNRGGRA